MAKYITMQTVPYNSLGILVLWHQRSWWNSNGISTSGAPNSCEKFVQISHDKYLPSCLHM